MLATCLRQRTDSEDAPPPHPLDPEQLQTCTTVDNGASKGVWFMAGATIFESYGWNYMGAPVLVRAQSILAVLASQVVLMGAIEA